jgi:hypothetical protein
MSKAMCIVLAALSQEVISLEFAKLVISAVEQDIISGAYAD